MDRHHNTQERIDGFQLFTPQSQRNVVKTSASVFLWNTNSQQVEFCHLSQNGGVKLLLLIPLLDVRRDFFLRKFPDGLHQRLVVVSQFEINHFSYSFQSGGKNDRTSY